MYGRLRTSVRSVENVVFPQQLVLTTITRLSRGFIGFRFCIVI